MILNNCDIALIIFLPPFRLSSFSSFAELLHVICIIYIVVELCVEHVNNVELVDTTFDDGRCKVS